MVLLVLGLVLGFFVLDWLLKLLAYAACAAVWLAGAAIALAIAASRLFWLGVAGLWGRLVPRR